jgi:hypothetical protein
MESHTYILHLLGSSLLQVLCWKHLEYHKLYENFLHISCFNSLEPIYFSDCNYMLFPNFRQYVLVVTSVL